MGRQKTKNRPGNVALQTKRAPVEARHNDSIDGSTTRPLVRLARQHTAEQQAIRQHASAAPHMSAHSMTAQRSSTAVMPQRAAAQQALPLRNAAPQQALPRSTEKQRAISRRPVSQPQQQAIATRRAQRVASARAWLVTHRRGLALWWGGVALTLLAIKLCQVTGIVAQFGAGMTDLGFDGERVLMMNFFFVALLGAAISSLLLRRRSAALSTSAFYFVLGYLIPFIQQAQHPGLGPGDVPQKLIPGALLGMALTLLAIAVVCAGLGAAVGGACGDLLVAPLLTLGQRLYRSWRRPAYERAHIRLTALLRPLTSLALGVFVIGALVVCANGVANVFTYGPTTSLYTIVQGAIPKGQLLHVTYNSPALGGRQRQIWVYLPPSYTSAKELRYPTLYLLHGSPGNAGEWFGRISANTLADTLAAQNKMRDTIIVGADGNGWSYIPEWANSLDGTQRMEDATAYDLVRYIDSHYRTLADRADRAIGGLSEGGYGAVNIALHHPDIFGTAFSTSGYFEAQGATFGSGPGSAAYRELNSPSLYIKTAVGLHALSQVRLIISVGTADGYYYRDSMAFYSEALALHGHATLLKNPGGHSWRVWAIAFGQALPLLEPPPINATKP